MDVSCLDRRLNKDKDLFFCEAIKSSEVIAHAAPTGQGQAGTDGASHSGNMT